MQKRNVYLLGITSFLNDLSSEIILPILPFFLKSFGAPYLGIGLVGGLIEGFSSVAKVFSGYLSDLFGKRKPIVFFGYLISQISKVFLAHSSSTFSAGFFVALDRFGKGIRTSPRDALISESKWESGKAFGLHRSLDTLGATIGSFIALLLIFYGFKYNKAIIFAAIIGFFSIIPIIFVKETGKSVKPTLDLKIKKYIAFALFFGFCNISYMFFLLKASDFGVEFAVALYLLFNSVYAFASYPFGVLSDRFGKTKLLSLAYAFLSISALFMIQNSLEFFVVAFILYGLFVAISDAQQRAFASELSISKGFGIGAFQFSYGISTIFGNTLMGFIAELSVDYVFMYLTLVSLIAAVIYYLYE